MPEEQRPANLIALARPNGSGKSTFFDRHIAKWGLPFINPDVIAKELAPQDPASVAFRAARVAEEQRQQLLQANLSFVTEGIRPDPKLLKQAKGRGFFTRVIFVCVESAVLNASRVIQRVANGGHTVPLEAIPARYERALKSLPEIAKLTDQLLLVDNSVRRRTPKLTARFDRGTVVSLRASVPAWADRMFGQEFAEFRAARLRERG